MALHPEIQEVVNRETGRHGLASNHLKGVIELIEKNDTIITPEVFQTLMNKTAEELNLEHADRIKDLKTVLKLRELTSAYIANAEEPANSNGQSESTNAKTTTVEFDLGDPLPTSAATEEQQTKSESFSLGDPLESENTEESEEIPVAKKLTTVNKSSVLTKVKPETVTAAVVEPTTEETETANVDTSTLIEIPSNQVAQEPVTESVTKYTTESTTESVTTTEETPVRKRRGRQPGTKNIPKVISDVDLIVSQLVDQIQTLQRENAALKAENESLKEDSHVSKVSMSTRKKLEALGINI